MEFNLIPMDCLTINKQDYTSKPISRRRPYIAKQEFKDPIAEPYRRFLVLNNLGKEEHAPIEKLDEYYDRFQKEYPVIFKLHVPTPVDTKVIKINNINLGRSVYQYYYCDLDRAKKYADIELAKKNFRLPDDWEIPPTTYLASFRKDGEKIFNSHPVFPVPNLTINEKEMKNFKTGHTEYQRTIGKTGEEIIECNIYDRKMQSPFSC